MPDDETLGTFNFLNEATLPFSFVSDAIVLSGREEERTGRPPLLRLDVTIRRASPDCSLLHLGYTFSGSIDYVAWMKRSGIRGTSTLLRMTKRPDDETLGIFDFDNIATLPFSLVFDAIVLSSFHP